MARAEEVRVKFNIEFVTNWKRVRKDLMEFARDTQVIDMVRRMTEAEDKLKRAIAQRIKLIERARRNYRKISVDVELKGADPGILGGLKKATEAYMKVIQDARASQEDILLAQERYNSAIDSANIALKKHAASLAKIKQTAKSAEIEKSVSSRVPTVPGLERATGATLRALRRQEAELLKATRLVEKYRDLVSKSGADPKFVTEAEKAFESFSEALKSGPLSPEGLQRVRYEFSKTMDELYGKLRDFRNAAMQLQQTRQATIVDEKIAKRVPTIPGIEKATGATLRALRRQEAELQRAILAYERFKTLVEKSGADPKFIKEAEKALRKFEAVLKSGALKPETLQRVRFEFNRTMGGLSDRIRAIKAAADKETQNRLQATLERISELGSSAQIALGPLSGVASRLTAFVTLSRKTTVAVAGLITSFIGLGAAIGFTAVRGAELERMYLRITGILEGLGEGARIGAGDILQIADAIDKISLAAKPEVFEALSRFLTITPLPRGGRERQEAFVRLVGEAANAMQQIYRGQLGAAVQRLGRVLQSPLTNLDTLKEAGVELTAQQKQLIATLMAQGNVLGAQAIILARFTKQMVAARTEAAGLSGAFDGLVNTLTNFLDSLVIVQDKATGEWMRSSFIIAAGHAISRLNENISRLIDNMNLGENAVRIMANTVRILDLTLNGLLGTINSLLEIKVVNWLAGTAVQAAALYVVFRGLGRVLERLKVGAGILAVFAAFKGFFTAARNIGLITALTTAFRTLFTVIRGVGGPIAMLASILFAVLPVGSWIEKLLAYLTGEQADSAHRNALKTAEALKELRGQFEKMLGVELPDNAVTNTKAFTDAVIEAIKEQTKIAPEVMAENLGRAMLEEMKRVGGVAGEALSFTLADSFVKGMNQLAAEVERDPTLLRAINRQLGGFVEITRRNWDTVVRIVAEGRSKLYRYLGQIRDDMVKSQIDIMQSTVRSGFTRGIGTEIANEIERAFRVIEEIRNSGLVKGDYNRALEGFAYSLNAILEAMSLGAGRGVGAAAVRVALAGFVKELAETAPNASEARRMLEELAKTLEKKIDIMEKAAAATEKYRNELKRAVNSIDVENLGSSLVKLARSLARIENEFAGQNARIFEKQRGTFMDFINNLSDELRKASYEADDALFDVGRKLDRMSDPILKARREIAKVLKERGLAARASDVFLRLLGLPEDGRAVEAELRRYIDEHLARALGAQRYERLVEVGVVDRIAEGFVKLYDTFRGRFTRENLDAFSKEMKRIDREFRQIRLNAEAMSDPMREITLSVEKYRDGLIENGKLTNEQIEILVTRKKHLEAERKIQEMIIELERKRLELVDQISSRSRKRIPMFDIVQFVKNAMRDLGYRGILGNDLKTLGQIEDSIRRSGVPSAVADKLVSLISSKRADIIRNLVGQADDAISQIEEKIKSITEKFSEAEIDPTIASAISSLNQTVAMLQSVGAFELARELSGKIDELTVKAKVANEIRKAKEFAKELEDAFKRAGDGLVDALITGKDIMDVMRGLANDIASTLIKAMIQRAVTDNITPTIDRFGQFIFNAIFGKTATGAAFSSGVRFLAKGGIIDSPTIFGTKSGLRIAGEAGTEAVLPLERRGGILGVRATVGNPIVNVNVINNSDSQIRVNRRIEGNNVNLDIIVYKVRDALGNGELDDIMASRYNVQPVGR